MSAVRTPGGHRPRLDHLLGETVRLCPIPVSTVLPGVPVLVLLVIVLAMVAVVDRYRAGLAGAAPLPTPGPTDGMEYPGGAGERPHAVSPTESRGHLLPP